MNELHYNRSVKLLLNDLAELNPQLGPTELACLWFDDLYFPGQTPPAGYPVETWIRGQQEWKACFNDDELKILAEFHEMFASEIETISETDQWQLDPKWQRVSRSARRALSQIQSLTQ